MVRFNAGLVSSDRTEGVAHSCFADMLITIVGATLYPLHVVTCVASDVLFHSDFMAARKAASFTDAAEAGTSALPANSEPAMTAVAAMRFVRVLIMVSPHGRV